MSEEKGYIQVMIERLRIDAERYCAIADELYAQAAVMEADLQRQELEQPALQEDRDETGQ